MSRDAKLLLHALLGDTTALHRLYLHYSQDIVTYINQHTPNDLRDKITVQVVLPHVFSKASASLSYLPAIDSEYFRRWILSIARDTLIYFIRCCRDKRCSLPEMPSGDYSASTTRRVRTTKLVMAIDQLPSPARSVVRLRYLNGLLDKEIAEANHLSIKDVQRLCQEGVQKLRDDLGSGVFLLTQ